MQAQRGKFLTGLIVVFAIAITFATLALIFIRDLVRALGTFPSWFNLFLVAFLLARWIALYMVWNFKRWGVYVLFLLECLEVAMGLFVFTTAFTLPIRLFVAMPSFLILLAIWFLALRPKWQLFT